MKKIDNRVPAFTIMDVLIGTIIYGVLVSSVYSVYSNLSQITIKYSSTLWTLNDFQLAKADLKRNIENSEEFLFYPKGFSVVKEKETIHYYLDGESLYKKTNIYNTVLFDNVKEIKRYSGLEKWNENSDRITSVSITFLVENQEFSVYLYHSFDSQNELNSTLLNEY